MDVFGDNEALDALRQLRLAREKIKRATSAVGDDSSSIGWLNSFAKLPMQSEEREMLLVAYGLRTLYLPEDLALLVQTFVEKDMQSAT